MALVFPRIAHNFIRNGYYPTDEATLSGVAASLDVATNAPIRLLDPCCGCGYALAALRDDLVARGASVQAYGVEFDAERAWNAKQLLDRVLHSDVNDVAVTARSIDLLFLNPPYGYTLRDDMRNGERKGSDRLEKMFFRKTVPWLAIGGVLVLIVPFAVLDEEFCQMIARQFSDVEIRMAPEQQFRQCVVIGRRRRADTPSAATVARVRAVATGGSEACATLLPEDPLGPYELHATAGPLGNFHALRIDAPQLRSEITRMHRSTLWPALPTFFGRTVLSNRPPLRELSDWHLALALAAGQIGGIVTDASHRRFLIKGDTLKTKDRKTETTIDEKGNAQVTIVMTDRFVPTIRAIDLTYGSTTFGEVFTIR